MKSMTATILAAALSATTAAAADAYDWTHLANVKAHQTSQTVVELPGGKSTVEVWAHDNAEISCTFIDRGTGNVAYQATKVQRCVGQASLSLPATMTVRITNESNKDLDYRIWIHETRQ